MDSFCLRKGSWECSFKFSIFVSGSPAGFRVNDGKQLLLQKKVLWTVPPEIPHIFSSLLGFSGEREWLLLKKNHWRPPVSGVASEKVPWTPYLFFAECLWRQEVGELLTCLTHTHPFRTKDPTCRRCWGTTWVAFLHFRQ